MRVIDGGDGRLDAGDAIEFYGEMRRGPEMWTKYSDENAYWLSVGEGPGLRMAEAAALPPDVLLPTADGFAERLHFEENRYWYTNAFVSLASRQTEDTWVWDWMAAQGSPVTATYAVTVPAPTTGHLTAHVRGELAGGITNVYGQHHVRVRLNGGTQCLSPTCFGQIARLHTSTRRWTRTDSGTD